MENKDYYVYYSYEEWGRGYIGYRKCRYKKGYTPETEPYWGTYSDKSFKPTEKIILFQDLTKLEAMEIEIKLHAFYNVKDNNHFANKANATSTSFNCDSVKGKSYYNNGIKEKRFSPDEKIPEGYIKGGLPKSPEIRLKYYARGVKGRIRINNGEIEKYINKDGEVPEGFIIGSLPKSEETKKKLSGENNHNYGKTKENHYNYGKEHYNNGIEQKLFSVDDVIPEGYIKGSIKSLENHYNYGKNWYNNGIEQKCYHHNDIIPDGFIIGNLLFGEKNPNYGKSIYNNGIQERFFSPDEKIPERFIKGRLDEFKSKQSINYTGEKNPFYGKTHSKESRRKISESGIGRISPSRIKVITTTCCYFSVTDARKELGISKNKFYKLFKKDTLTGFYVEIF